MKERAKLYKTKGKRTTHEIAKRLSHGNSKPEEAKQSSSASDKRVNLGGGKWHPAQQPASQGATPMQIQ